MPYKFTSAQPASPKTRKSPWVEWQGTQLHEAHLIIDAISSSAVNPDDDLTPHELAIGHIVTRTAEESIAWYCDLYRYVYSDTAAADMLKELGYAGWSLYLAPRFQRRSVKRNAWAHGIGRLAEEHVLDIAERDTAAIAAILGHKHFLLNDDRPQLADCALFGLLAALLHSFPDDMPLVLTVRRHHPRLVQYVERVKQRLFPDWDELVQVPVIDAGTQRTRRSISRT